MLSESVRFTSSKSKIDQMLSVPQNSLSNSVLDTAKAPEAHSFITPSATNVGDSEAQSNSGVSTVQKVQGFNFARTSFVDKLREACGTLEETPQQDSTPLKDMSSARHPLMGGLEDDESDIDVEEFQTNTLDFSSLQYSVQEAESEHPSNLLHVKRKMCSPKHCKGIQNNYMQYLSTLEK